jgi:hypothetical protein
MESGRSPVVIVTPASAGHEEAATKSATGFKKQSGLLVSSKMLPLTPQNETG